MRTSKTVDGVKYEYYYAGDQLVRMTYGNNILDFYYNAHGTPILLNCNGNLFYYITNVQGDVIRLVDIYGQIAAMYQYDPYGNAVYALGSHAEINPLRYRGYYYDTESGLYYLQSRYYDPAICRFINADAFASTGQGFLGYNMFAYCLNNPIARIDDWGSFSTSIYYTAYGEETQIFAFADKKKGDNWRSNPNKRKGSDSRRKTGDRERNVKHPNGEEHSRVPKGNGRGIRRFQAVAFDGYSLLETPSDATAADIFVTSAQNTKPSILDSQLPYMVSSNQSFFELFPAMLLGGGVLITVICVAEANALQANR